MAIGPLQAVVLPVRKWANHSTILPSRHLFSDLKTRGDVRRFAMQTLFLLGCDDWVNFVIPGIFWGEVAEV